MPPRIDAAAPLPALPSTMTVPDSIPSARPQPALPRDLDGGAVAHAAAVVADAALERDVARRQERDAQVVLRTGFAHGRRGDPSASAARIARLISRTGRSDGIDLDAADARCRPRSRQAAAAAAAVPMPQRGRRGLTVHGRRPPGPSAARMAISSLAMAT